MTLFASGARCRAPLRQKALSLLARRDHSVAELRYKLINKGYLAAEVDALLEEYCEKGWLDDQRFAESYVRRCQEKGYGPLKTQALLQQLGISPPLITAALEATSEDWEKIAARIVEKKIGNLDNITPPVAARLGRFLASRGFDWNMIRRIIFDS